LPLIKGTEIMNLLSYLHSSSILMRNKFLNFKKDSKGVAAVEFALISPILLLLFIGTIEVSLMVALDRKISRTSSAIADLIAQGVFTAGNTENEMRAIFGMADRIMFPYTDKVPCIVISSVLAEAENDTNGDGIIGNGDEVIARVRGSLDNRASSSEYTSPAQEQCSKANSQLAEGENARQERDLLSIIDLPDSINIHGTDLIIAEVEYDHTPIVGLISPSNKPADGSSEGFFTLGDRIYLRPRVPVNFE